MIREVRDTNKDVQKRLGVIETELTKTLGQAGRGFSEAEEAVKGVHSILDSNEDNIASIIAHLNETSRHLEALSEDIRLHPWKVVWKTDGTLDRLQCGAVEGKRQNRAIWERSSKRDISCVAIF